MRSKQKDYVQILEEVVITVFKNIHAVTGKIPPELTQCLQDVISKHSPKTQDVSVATLSKQELCFPIANSDDEY